MKNLLLILLTLAVPYVYAKGSYVGFRMGGAFSTLNPNGGSSEAQSIFNADKKLYPGATGGISIFGRINNYFAIEPEVNFAMKGLKYQNADGMHERRFMQAEFPVLAKVGYGRDHFFIYGEGGGYFAANVIVQDITKTDDAGRKKERVNFSDIGMKRYDAGISAGGGAMYISKRGALDLEFRYNIGMLNQVTDPKPDQPNAKWRSFGVSLAYMWKGGAQ